MSYFSDRKYLITGGASGIGLATTKLLLAEHARVAVWDINADAIAALSPTPGVLARCVDITDDAQVSHAMADITVEFGELDGVIHSAGVLRTGLFADLPPGDHERMITVNVVGPMLVTSHALPHLRRKGSLVFLASMSIPYGTPEFATYSAGKAAILHLAQALRIELEPAGVHVGVVVPAFVETPMTQHYNQTRMFRKFSSMQSTDAIGQLILRGIERRQFMIWAGFQPAFLYMISRLLYPLGHIIMRSIWGNPDDGTGSRKSPG